MLLVSSCSISEKSEMPVCFSASTTMLLSATRRLVVAVGPGILGLVLDEPVGTPDVIAGAGKSMKNDNQIVLTKQQNEQISNGKNSKV